MLSDKEWNDAIVAVESVLANRSLKGGKRAAAAIEALRNLGWLSPDEVSERVSDAMDEG